MLKELSERLHMIMSVHGFLEHEQATIETILPLVAPERVKLNDFINVVFKLSGKASFDSTGYAVGKKELRDKLTVEAYRIGKAAAMYYTMVVSDQTLYERAQINRTQLKRLSAGDLVNKARLISQTALPIKTLLLPYGVDAATVDALPGHIEAFFDKKDAPAEVRALKKSANKELLLLFKDAEAVLEQLDMLFDLLYFTQPSLHLQYKLSRKIKQLPTNRILKQGTLQPASRIAANYARGYLKAQNSITLINESARTKGAALQFYFAAKKGDLPAPSQSIIEVPAASEKTIPIAKYGFSEATPVLMIFNPSTKKIKWKTRVVLKEKK